MLSIMWAKRLPRESIHQPLLAVMLGFAGALSLATCSPPESRRAITRKATGSLSRPAQANEQLRLVPLEVLETAGVERIDWPVTAGIPLAAGVLNDPSAIDLLDGTRSIPVQAKALSLWRDGSVRWLLVDFQQTLEAFEKKRLTLRTGTVPALPRVAVHVTRSETGFEVNTGAVSFTISREQFSPLADFALARGPSAGPLGLSFSFSDSKAVPNPPRVVKAASMGPLRAELILEGSFTAPIDYLIRIDAYAGHPFVRVHYTFINRSDRFYTRIGTISADIPFGAKSRAFGGDGAEILIGPPADQSRLLQKDSRHFSTGQFDGSRAAGWAEARGEDGSLLLASRFFWQEYPQSLVVTKPGVTYRMWDGPSPLLLGSGAAKTHEFALMLRPAASSAEDAAETARALTTPVVVRPLPAYTISTRTAPNSVAGANPLQRYVFTAFSKSWKRYRHLADNDPWRDTGTINCSGPGPVRFGYYGMLNWGDWNFPGLEDKNEGCDGWGNLEYDLPQVLALAFLSGGSPEYRVFLDATARHYMDVDIIHHSASRPHLVGMNHPHKALHFALDSHTTIDLGHTWTEGLLSYYLLSGDRRALEAAKGIANYLVWRGENRRSGNPRQWGWPMLALASAYRVTSDGRYLQSAKVYAHRSMQIIPPAPLQSDFKLGILADGLSYVHELTGDETILMWLRDYAAALAEGPRGLYDIRLAPGVAYVSAIDGDSDLAQLATEAVRRARPGGWGKALAAVTRSMLRTSYLLSQSSSAFP